MGIIHYLMFYSILKKIKNPTETESDREIDGMIATGREYRRKSQVTLSKPPGLTIPKTMPVISNWQSNDLTPVCPIREHLNH